MLPLIVFGIGLVLLLPLAGVLWAVHNLNANRPPKLSITAASFKSSTGEDALHHRTASDVKCLLVDTFRLRVEDEMKFKGKLLGINNNRSQCLSDFKTLLNLAESRKGLLPKWWNSSIRRDCEQFAVQEMQGQYKYNGHPEGNIYSSTTEGRIQEHYADKNMAVKLRILGQRIYGTSVV
ncbi:hypothetical protein B0O99DRAFT_203296 [Bisporella sp. PMI_857]|nr:hypothetical protein B0O99DRAFT_203296 [Bisporella sp. PMI_857]